MKSAKTHRRTIGWVAAFAITVGLTLAWVGCASSGGTEETARGETFKSPEACVDALVGALRPYDAKRLHAILGPEGEEIVSSGDEVADRNRIDIFLAAYEVKHHIVKSPDGSATLMVGRLDWPLPIPMLEDDGSWRFDAAEGKEEILARRIGRNELEAMEVCRAIVDAQREFAEAAPAGGDQPPAFAQKFLSDEGQRNGLYWAAREGEEPSPLGPLVAQAQEEGYLRTEAGAEPQPYHGYYFRMLKAQGPSAPGGAAEYVVNGRMTGGFAVLAYPAEHGNSGIMAFLVSHSGVLYEADLGLDTVGIARSMNVYEPGPQWRACD